MKLKSIQMDSLNPKSRIMILIYLGILLPLSVYSTNEEIPMHIKKFVFDYLVQKSKLETISFTLKEKQDCIDYDELYLNKNKKIYIISVCSSHTRYYLLIIDKGNKEILELIKPNDNLKIIEILYRDKTISKDKSLDIYKKIINASQMNYERLHRYE